MRRLASRLAPFTAAGSPHPMTPYQVVLRAVEQDGRGLLAAAEVFKQFQRYYHSSQQEELLRQQSGGGGASSSDSFGAPKLQGKPLTQFCGRVEDVEPMTMLLLKVLCDLQKLEELRFLFTQCLLEMEHQTPSVELFNVYLLAISMTDTFNQYEVENLVELQRAKMIVPDVVTKLSMFLLYLRLGHQNCVAWWPIMRAEVEAIVEEGATVRYPLLPLRLQHCFQTLLRLHYDTKVIHECLQLLRRAAPERVTPSLMLPYLLLSALNAATPPSAVVEVLKMIEAPSPGSAAEGEKDTAAAGANASPELADGPLLSSETTVFRLLAKCAKYGDAAAAAYMRDYIAKYKNFTIIADENKAMASLLYVEALTKAGRVRAALHTLETEVPGPFNVPGERPKLFLQSRRLSLLTTDPVTNLVLALTPLVAALHVSDPVRTLAAEKTGAADEEERQPVPVTAVTLNLFVAACEHAGGAARAEDMLRLFPRYEVKPNGATYTLLLGVYAATAPVDGVARWASLHREMQDAEVAVDSSLLHVAMTVALNARDTGAALRVGDMHLAHSTSVDAKHGTRLLRELAAAADVDGMRKALRLLRASKSSVDPRSVALCTAVVKNLGISTDVLHEHSASS
ncbi:putative mitochondrial hypothetical protein [Leptomonas pyrrhocoris]|uniref:Uncharacterized protein n=1 Tax=Leptomonas pyrrhocoris TaxID=157538 RepID=A0A0N0DXW6_LEPPY|nr:putative mitochondrial hypothetical protein [Leptomonas pyrrhocoris]KPA83432.1 putative mitochondrial hypothetical protein [Leptomonas pyrrhocoris]|eukprot:XP_015661871.1 putative mitochondrial hypothetical protein [Leptomonas pyrrhocoris]